MSRTTPVQIRFPAETLKALTAAKEKNQRSMHAEILHRITASLAKDGLGPEQSVYGRSADQVEQNLALGRLVAIAAARLESLAGGEPITAPDQRGLVGETKLTPTILAMVARSLAVVFGELGAKDAPLNDGLRAIADAVGRQVLDDLSFAGFLAPEGLGPEQSALRAIHESWTRHFDQKDKQKGG